MKKISCITQQDLTGRKKKVNKMDKKPSKFMEKVNGVLKSKYFLYAKKMSVNHNYVISLVVLLIIGRIASPDFLTMGSLLTLMKSSVLIGIIALGMSLVILSGNIDLSVGSLLALVSANTVLIYNSTESVLVSLLFALAFGAVLGFVNGFFVGKAKVAAFIVTLSTMAAYRSLTLQLGAGGPILVDNEIYYGANSLLRDIGYGSFLSIPYLVWILVIVTILMVVLMSKTKFGRYVYAVGSNEKAAKLSGINVDRIKIYIFSLTGMLTGLASFLYVSRFAGVSAANAGSAFELDAIAAVAIGGVSMAGGKGFVQGSFFGAIIIFAIDTVLTAFRVPSFVNDLIKGILILGAVLMQKVLNSRKQED